MGPSKDKTKDQRRDFEDPKRPSRITVRAGALEAKFAIGVVDVTWGWQARSLWIRSIPRDVTSETITATTLQSTFLV